MTDNQRQRTDKTKPMRILVVSDSHGRDDYLLAVIEEEKPFDVMIHLGDFQTDEQDIEKMAGVPVFMVSGNCDYYTRTADVRILELEGHRIFMAHGHNHGVRWGETRRLARTAQKNRCDIVMFGHTHCPMEDYSEPGLIILNPGSIALPRQPGREHTYMIVNLQRGMRPRVELKYL